MSTRRDNIINDIVTTLGTISEFTTVELNRDKQVNDIDLPICIVTPELDVPDKEQSGLNSTVHILPVNLTVVSQTTDIEVLFEKIFNALKADDSRGGYADITDYYGPADFDMEFNFNLSKDAQAMTVAYGITYEF